jgi:hypothetical protein
VTPGYDPQRGHARARVDTTATAPVDALLGPLPDAPDADEADVPAPEAVVDAAATPAAATPAAEEPTAEAPKATTPREPLVLDLDPPAPVNVPRHRGRVVLLALAIASVVAQVVAWIWWRRRRARVAGDS